MARGRGALIAAATVPVNGCRQVRPRAAPALTAALTAWPPSVTAPPGGAAGVGREVSHLWFYLAIQVCGQLEAAPGGVCGCRCAETPKAPLRGSGAFVCLSGGAAGQERYSIFG
jgi:hypothetical protein